ncbi:hypothetical protein GL263_16495, partial [Streptomyces durbertensis]
MHPNVPSPTPPVPARGTPAPARERNNARPVAWEGVDLDEGAAQLERLTDEIAFLDRSAFLPASYRPATGLVRHVPVSPLLTA